MRLTADQFVALLDRHDALDLRPRSQGLEALVGAFIADGADDRPGHPAHDVRLVAEPADFLEDGGFVLFSNARLENDNHKYGSKKNRRWSTCGWCFNSKLPKAAPGAGSPGD